MVVLTDLFWVINCYIHIIAISVACTLKSVGVDFLTKTMALLTLQHIPAILCFWSTYFATSTHLWLSKTNLGLVKFFAFISVGLQKCDKHALEMSRCITNNVFFQVLVKHSLVGFGECYNL